MWWPLTLTYIFKVIGPWLENRVHSVMFSVLNRLFPYLPRIITTIRGSIIYKEILKFNFFANFSAFNLKKTTTLLAFFPYLAQIIISIRGCVTCNDLWPWPIFSRSFSPDLENRVRSVACTVLDGFFPYLVQMITSMRRCVTFDDLWPWTISSRSFDLDFENLVRSVMFSVLDWLFPYLSQIITKISGCVACYFDLGSDMNHWYG